MGFGVGNTGVTTLLVGGPAMRLPRVTSKITGRNAFGTCATTFGNKGRIAGKPFSMILGHSSSLTGRK